MKFKTKLAVYDFFGTHKAAMHSDYLDGEYTRLSEITEVEHDFIMLSEREVINNQVGIIDKEILEIKGKAMASVAKLEQKRQELLAITHEVNNEKH